MKKKGLKLINRRDFIKKTEIFSLMASSCTIRTPSEVRPKEIVGESVLNACEITWKYDRPELLQKLRDIKDNLKYLLEEGYKPTISPKEIGEEFTWLQYRQMRQVFKHPLEENFQVKRVPGFKWEYPHCEPMWFPRLDQKAKWAEFMPHPEKLE